MIGITASGECIMKYFNASMFYCSRMKICTPVTLRFFFVTESKSLQTFYEQSNPKLEAVRELPTFFPLYNRKPSKKMPKENLTMFSLSWRDERQEKQSAWYVH